MRRNSRLVINASSAKGRKYPASNSIVQKGATPDNKDEMSCFISGRHDGLEVHHIFNGPLRDWSDKNGLWVYLNHDVHMELHSHRPDWERNLKAMGQKEYELYHQHEEFMMHTRKNYL